MQPDPERGASPDVRTSSTSGYSGTPLAKKLGFGPSTRVYLIDSPKGYTELVAPIPPGLEFARRLSAQTDIVHLFAVDRTSLERRLRRLRRAIRPDGVIWVSWPKKSAGVQTTVTEDVIRAVALPLGFVDVKVCAVSEIWSGLKLVVRKELREGPPRTGRRKGL